MFTKRQRKEVAETIAHNASAILGGIADPTAQQIPLSARPMGSRESFQMLEYMVKLEN